MCLASSDTRRPPISPTSASTRCSIAARRAPASPPPTARSSASRGRWGRWPKRSTSRRCRRCPATSRSGTPAIQPRARANSRTRSRSSSTVRTARSPCATTATSSTPLELRDELVRNGSIFQTGSDTEVILHLYARSRAASVEEALERVDRAGPRRLLAGHADQEPADRRARSVRVPAARPRPPRRRLDRLLGNVRARPHRRDLRARRRAW